MKSFMTVLNDGWQSLKGAMFEYLSSKSTTGANISARPLNPVELHSFEEELPQCGTLYAQFMQDFDHCYANLQAMHVAKKPRNNEQLEQIKKLFDDYFHVVNIAKKEKNADIQSKLQKMFIKMTNLFNKQDIAAPISIKQSSMRAFPITPVVQISSVDTEFTIRTANS